MLGSFQEFIDDIVSCQVPCKYANPLLVASVASLESIAKLQCCMVLQNLIAEKNASKYKCIAHINPKYGVVHIRDNLVQEAVFSQPRRIAS